MTKWILGAVLALALAAPAAQAHTTISADSGDAAPYQKWVDNSKMPSPPIVLTVHDTGVSTDYECALALGCASRDGWIFVSPLGGLYTFRHELGHEFDFHVLTDEDRGRFLVIARRTGLSWDSEAVEAFAEAYRICSVRPTRERGQPQGIASWYMGSRELNRMCRLIRGAA